MVSSQNATASQLVTLIGKLSSSMKGNKSASEDDIRSVVENLKLFKETVQERKFEMNTTQAEKYVQVRARFEFWFAQPRSAVTRCASGTAFHRKNGLDANSNSGTKVVNILQYAQFERHVYSSIDDNLDDYDVDDDVMMMMMTTTMTTMMMTTMMMMMS